MALWACAELLRGYGAFLSAARDEVLIETRRTAASLRRLRHVRRRLLGDAADARTLAEELVRAATRDGTAAWRLEVDFEAAQPDYWRQSHLHDVLLSEIRRRARFVAASERRVRNDLAVDSQVVGAIASLRVQRLVGVMTVVIGLVSVALVAYQIWGS